MKTVNVKRIVLGLIQHCCMAVAIVSAMGVLGNCYLNVKSVYGGMASYGVSTLDSTVSFVDSEAFRYMFQEIALSVPELIVIKGQLETDGEFDAQKEINIFQYAHRKNPVEGYDTSAVYTLEDLIQWGDAGVVRETVTMNKEEFVTYFGSQYISQEYFYLDENNSLQFRGFSNDATEMKDAVVITGTETETSIAITEDSTEAATENSEPAEYQNILIEQAVGEDFFYQVETSELSEIFSVYYQYAYDQLIDLIYEYIVSNVIYNENGSVYGDFVWTEGTGNNTAVTVSMVKCTQRMTDGRTQLSLLADNWDEYFQLEQDLINSIEDIRVNYQMYMTYKDSVLELEDSNLAYVVYVNVPEGTQVYTNRPEIADYREDELQEYFQELGKYAYLTSDNNLVESNINGINENILNSISRYGYIYRNGNMECWIGVDTSFPVKTDMFAEANAQYEMLPAFWQYLGVMLVCMAAWLVLWLYLSATAGRVIGENKVKTYCLKWFDKIWTEVVLVFGLVLAYIGTWGFLLIREINVGYYWGILSQNYNFTSWYVVGIALAYGFLASLTFSFMWYSLIRRIRCHNLWKDSFLHFLCSRLWKGLQYVLCHKNAFVRTIVPYLLFLGVNGLGVLLTFWFLYYHWMAILMVIGIVCVFDIAVGAMLLIQNSGRIEIMEGIEKIREGNVESQLEPNKLYGENRKMAEAVNNIGEGIRNAVETSMKDERLKTDLITNVSHDIKTPLTSIINYVDLLKREQIETEPIKGYIEILDAKSQRLKQLTDDLVEASKISSGNIVLQMERLNLSELLNQAAGEFAEKFAQSQLEVIFSSLDKPAFIWADSRRMWRVVENIFNNICKYAMPGTRVYLDMTVANGLVEAAVKNISALPLNITPEELTERFIRGDSSRTTEGSGLGLSIAKSLMEAQNGQFHIYLDGDLFKVTLRFQEYVKSRENTETENPEKRDNEEK